MNHPLRENIEVYSGSGGDWIRCERCGHRLCSAQDNWREFCVRRTFSPIKAGPLMTDLIGHYVFEKLYCPGCKTLFDADMVRVKAITSST